jgi:cytidine deaminase
MPKDSFIKMVIVSSSDTPAYPCGACRQVLWEWAPNLQIVTISKNGKSKEISLKSLFPKPFRFDF